MDNILSPGLRVAKNTAKFAVDPECGCTLTCSAPNNFFALSIANFSISSMISFPP